MTSWRPKLLILVVLAVGVAACGSGAVEPGTADESVIYADLATRLCDRARCGPSHPAFALMDAPTVDARSGVKAALPDAVFITTTDGLIGPDDRVIDGGRILHFGPLRAGPEDEVVLVDTYWESGRSDGKGETYVYEWDGTAWVNVEPSRVGVTVTTAVP